MYSRLTSNWLPAKVLKTEMSYTTANDKSCVLIKCEADEDGNLLVGPVATATHAVHVYRNPELGLAPVQIITPDDGPVTLNAPTKAKQKIAGDLDWHYKIFIVRVDNPVLGN